MRCLALILCCCLCAVAHAADFAESFETPAVPKSWQTAGDVAVVKGERFGEGSWLRLSRQLKDADAPVNAAGPVFEVSPGLWDITCWARTAMESPDTSYAGVLTIELTDAAGKLVERKTLLELSGQSGIKRIAQRIEFPAGVAKAAFKARLDKAIGSFDLDELSAKYVGPAPVRDNRIDRVMFIPPNPTGLLLPGDPRVFTLWVEATKPLAPEQLQATWSVRDYFGAEQLAPAKVALTKQDKHGENGRIVYAGQVDVAAAPLEIGRYYELHAEVPQAGEEPYREFSSFAILPEAAANAFKPEEIPFSGRSWDNRNKDHVLLSRRLGLRIIGLRTGWSAEPPAATEMPHTELVEQMPATWMGRSPNFIIEQRLKGYEKYTEEALRAMVRDYAEKYERPFPTYMSLGNEPHGPIERVRANIAAYKATYEEFKKSAPNVFCIGTAVGADEPYFAEGFGAYCDAYDYHTYGGHQVHRRIMARYRELFKKYGHEKPVWVTELGLNAQGMSRHAIAQEVPKHFAVAFAEGVANASWFGTCFPDPDGKIEGSNGDSFNLFRGKYRVFAPRMDAIAYYNTINTIANKKFVQEKVYDGQVAAVLFRNAEGKACQILWAGKGRVDVGVPLAGVGKVKLIALDGRLSEVDAAQKGVTVSLSEDPVFLEYEGPATLADQLDAPAVKVVSLPKSAVKGVPSTVVLSGDGEVIAPPFWTVARGERPGHFQVTPPAASAVREGQILVKLPAGELGFRLPVSGKIASQLLPVAAAPDQPAAVRLVLRNVGGESQSVAWKLSIEDQASPVSGMYDEAVPATAYFAKAAEGTTPVDAGGVAEVVLPIASADPLVRYRVRATIKDADGRTTVIDRYVAGFAGVPRAAAAPTIDGKLDDASWAAAAVQNLDRPEQYNAFKKPNSKWDSPADLSAKLRFLWDDTHLYLSADVADDVFRNVNADDALWSGDGLQMLIDAARDSAEKPGKYDLAAALGAKGPQAWCYLSADAGVPTGEVKDIRVAIVRDEKTGGATYELAIPWTRLAPFKPAAGANLGFAMGLNEDDGQGRNGLMSWFGNVHSKQLDSVGDLILLP